MERLLVYAIACMAAIYLVVRYARQYQEFIQRKIYRDVCERARKDFEHTKIEEELEKKRKIDELREQLMVTSQKITEEQSKEQPSPSS